MSKLTIKNQELKPIGSFYSFLLYIFVYHFDTINFVSLVLFGISIKNSFFTLYPLIKSGLYQEIFDIIIDIMKKREDLQFKITNKIKNLEIGELKDNLFSLLL